MRQGIRKKPKHRGHSPLNVHCSALQILYMLKQLLNSSQMEGLKPGGPGKVESGETCHQGFIPNSFGPSAKMQEERQCAATQPSGTAITSQYGSSLKFITPIAGRKYYI